jgi:hypothetical protein
MALSILVLALLALVVAVSVRGHRRGTRRFELHQFRPAAPFAGVLVDRDVERIAADLRAHPDATADVHLHTH